MPRARVQAGLVVALVAAVLLTAARLAAADLGPFPELVWKVDDRIEDAQRVFPSPVDPNTIYVASGAGLQLSADGGAAWRLIPQTDPSRLGSVAGLAVCPARPAFVVLGSREKGIFLSDDGGATWRPGGGAAAGLASEKVHGVFFSSEDRAWQTLLVFHGADAPGISKSIDGGRHWRVLAPARHFRAIAGTAQVLSASSASADDPQNWQLARSLNYGESWNVPRRDVAPTDGATSLMPPWISLWGQSGGRLLVTTDGGWTWDDSKVVPEGRWLSAFVTPGRTPLEQWFWVYDPFQNGLYTGRYFDEPWTPRNRGLYVNRMIRSRGRDAAADAAGLRFYACINGSLYVGEQAMGTAPVIRGAWADPPVLALKRQMEGADAREAIAAAGKRIVDGAPLDAEIGRVAEQGKVLRRVAAGRSFRVCVRVEHPKGPGAVRSVKVAPDLFGLDPLSLSDDGRHDDDAALDGLWAAWFAFVPDQLWDHKRGEQSGRLAFPGTRMLLVEAVDTEGQRAFWSLPVSVFFEPEPLEISYDPGRYAQPVRGAPLIEGAVTMTVKDKAGPREGRALEIVAAKGPWEAAWVMRNGSDADITGLACVTFALRGSPGAGDVELFLVDEMNGPTRYGRDSIEPRAFSRAVPLVAGKYLSAMDGQYHTVRVPVRELVREMRFMRRHLSGFGLRSLGTGAGGTYHVGEVRFVNE